MTMRKYTTAVMRTVTFDAEELSVVQRAMRELSMRYDQSVSLSDLCRVAIAVYTAKLHAENMLSANAVLPNPDLV